MSTPTTTANLPAPGTYPIKLGDSFKEAAQIHIMRYGFKPASVDSSQVADFCVSYGERVPRGSLVCGTTKSPDSNMEFEGERAKSTGAAATCLIMFDPVTKQFTLEKIQDTWMMKQVENSTKQRLQTTTAQMVRTATRASAATSDNKKRSKSSDSNEEDLGTNNDESIAPPPTKKPRSTPPPAPVTLVSHHPEFAPDDSMDATEASHTLPAAASLQPIISIVPSTASPTSRPLSTPTVVADFNFAFPTTASLRETEAATAAAATTVTSTTATATPCASTLGEPCTICTQQIVMSSADLESELDSPELDAEKESRRTYLHCVSCLTYQHKTCLVKAAATQLGLPETDPTVQSRLERKDREWNCTQCL